MAKEHMGSEGRRKQEWWEWKGERKERKRKANENGKREAKTLWKKKTEEKAGISVADLMAEENQWKCNVKKKRNEEKIEKYNEENINNLNAMKEMKNGRGQCESLAAQMCESEEKKKKSTIYAEENHVKYWENRIRKQCGNEESINESTWRESY